LPSRTFQSATFEARGHDIHHDLVGRSHGIGNDAILQDFRLAMPFNDNRFHEFLTLAKTIAFFY
jgi:hypothetical protein